MANLAEQIQDIELEFKEKLRHANGAISKLDSETDISNFTRELSVSFLGAESGLVKVLRKLKDIKDPAEKKRNGADANKVRQRIEADIERLEQKSVRELTERKLKSEMLDVTGSATNSSKLSHQHIITKTAQEIEDIFRQMGFGVEYANEVDTAFNAFDALNIPKSHPARDSWDTLWLEDGNLAIPHTSAMQNRILQAAETPIRKVIIGKCFRNEATDARHEHTFMQVEGVYLDTTCSMADMLGILLEFFENFFQKKLNYKFTPDFFPFVEPGGQMAFELQLKSWDVSAVTKTGFLEVLGCGMIHPKVLEMAGKDPSKYSGFAWGFGLERVAMLKYGIGDIRSFYGNNIKFSAQNI